MSEYNYLADLLGAKYSTTILYFLIYGCMWDSGAAISERQERTGGYSCTCWWFSPIDYCRALMSGISALNPLGILASISGCCDNSGSTNAKQHPPIKTNYYSTKVSGLLITANIS